MNTEFSAAVITCSDTCFDTNAPDLSGDHLVQLLLSAGFEPIYRVIVPDDILTIRTALVYYADIEPVSLILTTGGTGFSPKDVTPEATAPLLERPAPGLMEFARAYTGRDKPLAFTSRGVAGTRHKSLILNFPGNPKAVVEYWNVLYPLIMHALALLGERPLAHHRSQPSPEENA